MEYLIAACSHCDDHGKGSSTFKEMTNVISLWLDDFTYASALAACAGITSVRHGKQIHAHLIRTKLDGDVGSRSHKNGISRPGCWLSIIFYYTFWVIILPFVDGDHFIHKYFLPQEYAVLIPVFPGVAILNFLSIFIGRVMLKSKKKMKKA
ncbi:Dolichol-phosphate mannose synthase subunit 2 [Camellia lanceoleosa]|uniref:Dolichol-phosphate mannose synthase subunit 2 n=1 Tax=Camellia lanceoleosa TaxID=1840588 RepID=A0ACC0FJ65_9ERIC|nr:Dolichol-phosphate mannose synthase subunit 2 [Camellia lanceoleosa]